MFVSATGDVFAADEPSLTGKWMVHASVAGNEADMDCTFVQKNSQLTGSCTSERSSGPIKGTVDGKNTAWTMQNEKSGTTTEYAGTMNSRDKISGKINVPQYNVDGEFAATRVK